MAARSPRRQGPARRPVVAALLLGALAASGLLAGCGSDTDAEPTPVSADFSPRLAVEATATGLEATVAPRGEGDERVSAEPAETPAGSVIVVGTSDAAGDHRVRAELAPAEGGDASPYLDTGVLRAGQEVTVVLADAGTLTFTDDARPGESLELTVTPRPEG